MGAERPEGVRWGKQRIRVLDEDEEDFGLDLDPDEDDEVDEDDEADEGRGVDDDSDPEIVSVVRLKTSHMADCLIENG